MKRSVLLFPAFFLTIIIASCSTRPVIELGDSVVLNSIHMNWWEGLTLADEFPQVLLGNFNVNELKALGTWSGYNDKALIDYVIFPNKLAVLNFYVLGSQIENKKVSFVGEWKIMGEQLMMTARYVVVRDKPTIQIGDVFAVSTDIGLNDLNVISEQGYTKRKVKMGMDKKISSEFGVPIDYAVFVRNIAEVDITDNSRLVNSSLKILSTDYFEKHGLSDILQTKENIILLLDEGLHY